MECLLTFLILFVTVVFVTGSFAHSHARRARRRLMFEHLARRYGGSFVPGSIWRRAGVLLRYGEAQGTLQETRHGRPYLGKCTQLTMVWPDAECRCEVAPRALRDSPTLLYFLPEVPTGDDAFDKRFAVRGLGDQLAASLLRENVRWQVERLAQLFASDSVYVVIQNGRMTVRKPGVVTRYDDLQAFVEHSWALYDQLMLTRVRGIDFLDEQEARTLGEVTCPVCGDTVIDRMVYCRRCKTPHHADCWQFVGACSVYGCGETRSLEPQKARTVGPARMPAANGQPRPDDPPPTNDQTSQT